MTFSKWWKKERKNCHRIGKNPLPSPSFGIQGSPLGDPLGQAFPRVGQSKTIVLAGTKSPRLTWGSSHSTGPRAGFWPKKEGEEKAVWEGRERTSGQVEARRWSGRVACRVWKRECGPRRTAPPLAPLVLVSSWKSIAGKRVKIHPCPRKNLTQGWTGSAGGGLKSEKEGKGWRGKEKEGGRERGRESGRGWGGDLGETRFTYLGVVLPTLSGSPLLAETCLVCAILAFTALKHRRSLAGKNSTGMELPRIE